MVKIHDTTLILASGGMFMVLSWCAPYASSSPSPFIALHTVAIMLLTVTSSTGKHRRT
jgi:hypothetical protein